MRYLLACIITVILVGGCSKPVLKIDEPDKVEITNAKDVLLSTPLDPSRNTPRLQMTPAVNRVLPPIRSASFEICSELEQPADRCDLMLNSEVLVFTDEADINAFADHYNNVGVLGGLVSVSGSDDEIAAVLAHEFSHVMYGHVEKKMENALFGMALAGGLAAGIQAYGGYDDPQLTADYMELGMEVGASAYGPEMEIESDRTAIYILKRAGYRPSAMRDVIVRFSQVNATQKRGPFAGSVGFLQTHPSNDRRIAHILSAIEDVEAGMPLVLAR